MEEPTKEPEPTTEPVEEPKSTLVDDTNLAAKRLEDATKAAQEERLAREASYAKMKLGGITEAGMQPIPEKKETDDEYAERLQRGEANPLKDDGFR